MRRDVGFGSASSGPWTAVPISNPLLNRLFTAHARRRLRRLPGLSDDQRQSLLEALSQKAWYETARSGLTVSGRADEDGPVADEQPGRALRIGVR